MSFFSPIRSDPKRRSYTVTVLDVGTSKVCCMIARLSPSGTMQTLNGRTHDMRVVGFGLQRSDGIERGMITDLQRAEYAIRQAVAAAEGEAGLTADSLIVNLSGGHPRSQTYNAEISLGGHAVERNDISRVLMHGAAAAEAEERSVIHSLPTVYRLDDEDGISDPTGMVGETLGVDIHVVGVDAAPIRNLELCINRSHLSVERVVATAYASGLATLVEDEAKIGAASIDIGGSTSSIGIFRGGRFIHAETIPVGGRHVTLDLARGLNCSIEDAERLKVIHGSALPSGADDREMISFAPIGEPHGEQISVPRSLVTKIVRARTEEMLEHLGARLSASGLSGCVGKRIVLTGGGSQLSGLVEVGRRILGRNVRIGRPLGISGLPQQARGPDFATAVGLLVYPQVASLELAESIWRQPLNMAGSNGRLAQVKQWIMSSF